MLDELNFSKQKRLLSAADFKDVYRKAKRFSENHFTIITKPNNKSFARIGFGFSGKKVKSAVVRNTLKRIGRESFRLIHAELPAIDIVVVANCKITELDKRAVRTDFDKLWQQLHKQYEA